MSTFGDFMIDEAVKRNKEMDDLRQERNRLFRALVALMRNPCINLGDQVYDVREFEGQGWDGPHVKAWGDAVSEAEAILKERGIPPWPARDSQGKKPDEPR